MITSTNYAALFYSETDNDLEVLERNVQDFPASSVARFLLLYHHKKNNNPAFQELAKQTALFLNNPIWSEYQLWQIDNPTENISEEKINEEESTASANEDIIDVPSSAEENNDKSSAEIKEQEEISSSVNEEIIEIPSSEIASNNHVNNQNSLEEIKEEKQFPTSESEEIIEIP